MAGPSLLDFASAAHTVPLTPAKDSGQHLKHMERRDAALAEVLALGRSTLPKEAFDLPCLPHQSTCCPPQDHCNGQR